MTNDAAGRLREFLREGKGDPGEDDLDAALAAERRATVERIRTALGERVYASGGLGLGFTGQQKWDRIVAVLDAEAGR